MALKKRVVMANGLPLEYHKISLVTIEPIQQITLLRHSYLDEEARQYMKDWDDGKIEGELQLPYIDYEYISIPYEGNVEAFKLGVMEGAYALLKEHRPEFADAEDLL